MKSQKSRNSRVRRQKRSVNYNARNLRNTLNKSPEGYMIRQNRVGWSVHHIPVGSGSGRMLLTGFETAAAAVEYAVECAELQS